MNNRFSQLALLLLSALLVFACQQQTSTEPRAEALPQSEDQRFRDRVPDALDVGKIVIADRASGTISVIDVATDQVSGTYELPAAANQSEPMYVTYVLHTRTVFVGDRANDRVVAFDAETFEVKATIPTGKGVFHMWNDPRGKQLWVNNDIDNTITVIDPGSYQVIETIAVPQDLVDMGGKPHDVILDPQGRNAFITMLGIQGESDYVVKYSTRTFTETARAAVGQDPHLSLTQKNNLLYVPCQNSDAVFVLNRHDLSLNQMIDVPGAHGAGMPLEGDTFYTTNLPGGGPDGLWAIDVQSNSVQGNIDTPFPIPHNIALTPDGSKLYVTHSGGSSDKVTIYRVMGDKLPVYKKVVTVGFNPFGLAYAY